MLWVVLRLNRLSIAIAAAFSIAILVVFGFQARKVHELVAEAQLRACGSGPTGGCLDINSVLVDKWQQFQPILTPLALIPILIGAFWGAPIYARFSEQKTLVLLWTQAKTRKKWLTVNLAIFATMAIAVGASTGAALGIWLGAFKGVELPGTGQDLSFFASRGVAPIAWNLSVLMVGVSLGALFKRTLIAMGATMALGLVLTMVLNSDRESILATFGGLTTVFASDYFWRLQVAESLSLLAIFVVLMLALFRTVGSYKVDA